MYIMLRSDVRFVVLEFVHVLVEQFFFPGVEVPQLRQTVGHALQPLKLFLLLIEILNLVLALAFLYDLEVMLDPFFVVYDSDSRQQSAFLL
jgi:hypothetical protein